MTSFQEFVVTVLVAYTLVRMSMDIVKVFCPPPYAGPTCEYCKARYGLNMLFADAAKTKLYWVCDICLLKLRGK